jgi:invasion protein IalB
MYWAMKPGFLTAGCVAAAMLAMARPTAAAEQGPFGTPVGTFNDWTAFTGTEGKDKVCYVGAKPQKATGNYTKRDDTYVLVTHRPPGSMGVVSVEAGYAYKDGADVDVAIEGVGSFKFFGAGGQAWARQGDDSKVVGAMKAGKSMTIKGMSSRGTATVDTYSLAGFTAAYGAIDKACPAK